MRKLGVIFASVAATMLVVGGIWAVVTRQNTDTRQSDAAHPGTTATSTPRPGKVRVRASTYVGMPVQQAVRDLRRLGFTVTTRVRTNPGTEAAGTVAGVAPTGLLTPGSRVVLSAWGPRPAAPTPASSAPAGSGGSGAHAGTHPGTPGQGTGNPGHGAGGQGPGGQHGNGGSNGKGKGNGNGNGNGKGGGHGKGKGGGKGGGTGSGNGGGGNGHKRKR
jgi:hypothetical protein